MIEKAFTAGPACGQYTCSKQLFQARALKVLQTAYAPAETTHSRPISLWLHHKPNSMQARGKVKVPTQMVTPLQQPRSMPHQHCGVALVCQHSHVPTIRISILGERDPLEGVGIGCKSGTASHGHWHIWACADDACRCQAETPSRSCIHPHTI